MKGDGSTKHVSAIKKEKEKRKKPWKITAKRGPKIKTISNKITDAGASKGQGSSPF